MGLPLRILLVEDSEDDAELMLRQLRWIGKNADDDAHLLVVGMVLLPNKSDASPEL